MAIAADGTRLATDGDDATVRIWDPEVGAAVLTWGDVPGVVECKCSPGLVTEVAGHSVWVPGRRGGPRWTVLTLQAHVTPVNDLDNLVDHPRSRATSIAAGYRRDAEIGTPQAR